MRLKLKNSSTKNVARKSGVVASSQKQERLSRAKRLSASDRPNDRGKPLIYAKKPHNDIDPKRNAHRESHKVPGLDYSMRSKSRGGTRGRLRISYCR